MPVSEATYECVALEDDETKWELVCGRLVAKLEMTTEHGNTARRLVRRLVLQLSESDFAVEREGPRLRVASGTYRVPNVCVIPAALVQQRLVNLPERLEVYEQPMPLAVEVWSPSTGEADRTDKLREYQQRGDLAIWHIQPYERTLTAWWRRPDGSYTETHDGSGTVEVASLPSVVIDLDALFD